MFIVSRFSSIELTPLTQDYAYVLFNHILHHTANHNDNVTSRLGHTLLFEHYAGNDLYYSRPEAIMFSELDYHEESKALRRVVDWLIRTRNFFPDKPMRLEFILTQDTVGVTYCDN